jgi:putative endonuclease
MPYYVYILYSAQKDKYYIGQTEDVDRRLQEHNIRKNLGADDWVLKYKEVFDSRGEAVKRELEIKNKKKRSYIERLILERPA